MATDVSVTRLTANAPAAASRKKFPKNTMTDRDPRLSGLSQELGGTPVGLCEEREYRAEENAMRYLLERITDRSLRRALLSSVKQTIGFFARNFEKRFIQIARSELSHPGLSACSKHAVGVKQR